MNNLCLTCGLPEHHSGHKGNHPYMPSLHARHREVLEGLVKSWRENRDYISSHMVNVSDHRITMTYHKCSNELEATLQRLSREVDNEPKPPSPFCYDVQRCTGLRSCPKGRACNE